MRRIWSRIVEEATLLFKFWSVRVAALGGLIVAYLMSDPTLLPRLVNYVPQEYRPLMSIFIGFVAFALPTIARRLPQPKLKKDIEDANIQRP
ncbi:MAG: hypothetical protein E6Q97_11175 [Desulfurellales bacterium]|nr:MAG: hypothetical protein E6Q97_11175 [Desulfurellales bacterium]